MKINITVEPPPRKGQFAILKIETEEENKQQSTLHFDFYKLYEFGKDNTSVAFDFLLISLFTYGIDKLLMRNVYSVDGWSREIEVCFPVVNLGKWKRAKSQFEKTLSFLTGDYWKLSFEKYPIANLYPHPIIRNKVNRKSYKKEEFKSVSLFSGGLDSLVGVIDLLEEKKNTNDKLLLASHFDGGAGAKSDQERILPFLNRTYTNKFEQIMCSGRLLNNKDLAREPSSRSRSVMFIGIGIYLAFNIGEGIPLIIPENGTISLNIPLSPSRRSSCSTRTTHPYFLSSLQKVLNKIGIKNQLSNPYQFQTKGELVANCKNLKFLKQVAFESVSCGKRGHVKLWDNKGNDVRNCGKCMPCIYRRASLHKIKLDKEPFGIDIFTSPNFDIDSKHNDSTNDINACLSFLKKQHSKNEISRQLLINGLFDSSTLEQFSEVVLRTKKELKDWIKSKKNKKYITRAGIK